MTNKIIQLESPYLRPMNLLGLAKRLGDPTPSQENYMCNVEKYISNFDILRYELVDLEEIYNFWVEDLKGGDLEKYFLPLKEFNDKELFNEISAVEQEVVNSSYDYYEALRMIEDDNISDILIEAYDKHCLSLNLMYAERFMRTTSSIINKLSDNSNNEIFAGGSS